jgi:hypothetical protein
LSELREALEMLSRGIERRVRAEDKTLFYACFLWLPSGIAYVSNGDRAEIQRLLPELVRRMDGSLAAPEPERESPEHQDARLAVQRVGAEVGRRFAGEQKKLALFVFKNSADCPDGRGVNTWFTNVPNAPEAIRAWLAKGVG